MNGDSDPGIILGALLALLRTEFPSLTTSNIRFLESEGFINPTRSATGGRRFSEDDITRLRFILNQQRDHHQSLKQIKSRLEFGWGPRAEQVNGDAENRDGK